MNKAVFVTEITVTDPDTNALVWLSVFKDHISGSLFAIDSSYLEQTFEDDDIIAVPNVFLSDTSRFNRQSCLQLTGEF